MILRSLLAAVVLFAAFGASAQPAPVTNSRMVPAQVQPRADAALDERQAREWGLHPEEWARYRQLMQGPLGIYSPQLDPLTALGIEARSEEERRRYLVESLFLNSVTYENEMLDAYMRRLTGPRKKGRGRAPAGRSS